MKNYRQLLRELPAKTIVFAFGRFNPPTIGHELLFKMIKKIAIQQKADHVIYASRTQDKKKNPLSIDRKMHYLKMMFKGFNFVAANQNERTFIEAVKNLNKRYKNIIMVAGSDRIAEYEGILNRYNGKDFKYDTIQVVSAGERDPDSDNASGMSASKMRQFASKGNLVQFKRGLPNSVRDIDARLLMNEIRQSMGLDAIKEEVKFSIDELREKYFKGEIFHIGDIVESSGNEYEIMDRGSNYVTVVDNNGKLYRKWIQDLKVIRHSIHENNKYLELCYKGYTPENIKDKIIIESFKKTLNDKTINDPLAILNALKLTNSYVMMKENATLDDYKRWDSELDRAKESLENINKFNIHEEYWLTYKQELNKMIDKKLDEDLSKKTIRPADKIKVARIIADMLGVERADDMSSPTQLINLAMRKVKTKVLRPEMINVLKKMLKLADSLDIKYDKATLHAKLKESVEVNKKSNYNAAKDIMRYSDFIKLLRLNKMGAKVNPEIDGGEAVGFRPSATGSNLDVDHQLRRRKVKYHLGEAEKHEYVDVDKLYEAQEKYLEEDKASANYKLSKSGRKIPARHLYHKDAKRGEDKGPEKENELKLKKEKEKIAKSHQGIDDIEEAYITEDEMEWCNHNGIRIPCADIPEDEIEKMVDKIKDEDDVMDAYDDEELEIIDDETGEVVDSNLKEENEQLNEVLSRAERIKAKIRFARHKAKRSRKLRIALKRRSSVPVLNVRARKLARKLIKQRLAKKPLNKLSVGEKERLERIIQKRRQLISRIAMRLVPRIRKIETARLQGKKAGGKAAAVGF